MRRELRVNSRTRVSAMRTSIGRCIRGPPSRARAGEVAVVNATGALTISFRIEPEQDARDLRPLGALFGGVEKTDIECEVLSVVVRHAGALRGLIGKHGAVRCARPLLSRFALVQRRPWS